MPAASAATSSDTTPSDLPSPRYVRRAIAALVVTAAAYFVINGSGFFETAVIVPVWAGDPPASLALLQGPYAPDLQTFWIVAHTAHELTFLAAIALCWRLVDVRRALLGLFAVHVALRVWTVAYFAPRIIEFRSEAANAIAPAVLAEQTASWQGLNLVRSVLFLAVNVALLPLIARALRHDPRAQT